MPAELSKRHIRHIDEMEKYSPPGHAGTVNVRLFDRKFCENFEMVLGEIEPGGVAHKHHHDKEHQAMFVLSGRAGVALGEEAAVECGPGSVIELPPMLDHFVESLGPEPLKLMIVYSPPLPKRDDKPV